MMLTAEQRKAIHGLQQIVEKEDVIQLKLNWDMLASENRSVNRPEDYFHYDANGRLLGFFCYLSIWR